MEERPQPPAKKKRSKVACKRCHARRIKCDAASIGLPCTNCNNVGHGSHCDFITSNKTRGEKGRFKSRTQAPPAPAVPASSSTPDSDEVITSPSVANEQMNGQWRQPKPGQQLTRRGGYESEAEQWSQLTSIDNPHASHTGQFTYVGESWSLSYTVHLGSTAKGSFKPIKLHLPTPGQVEEEPTVMDFRNKTLAQNIVDKMPSMEIQAALIDAYLSHGYPIYPIINPQTFTSSVASKTVSKLLLSAILFCGAIHADVSVIHKAGYSARLECLAALYDQTKALYHTDTEQDKIAVIQATFILHQHWSNPSTMWDPWTWLGHAIRLAQTMGMHRTTSKSPLSPPERRLWKRLWWCLYCREKQMASALGRPGMINDVDCDIEPIGIEDFEPQEPALPKLFVIEQCKLASILGAATQYYFSPGLRDEPDAQQKRALLLSQAHAWKENLPPILKYTPSDFSGQQNIYTLFLGVLFYSMILVFHRPRIGTTQPPFEAIDTSSPSTQLAFEAAATITKITELIMNYHSLFQVPLFYTSSLFAAMTMQVMKGPTADHQLSLCMIALRTIETMYPSAGWIRKIFTKISDRRGGPGVTNRSSTTTRQTSPQPQAQNESQQRLHPVPEPPQHQHQPMPGPVPNGVPNGIGMEQFQPMNHQPHPHSIPHRGSGSEPPPPIYPGYHPMHHPPPPHNQHPHANGIVQTTEPPPPDAIYIPENAITPYGAPPGPDELDMSDSGVEWSGLDQWENGEMMVYLQHLMGGEVPYPGVGGQEYVN